MNKNIVALLIMSFILTNTIAQESSATKAAIENAQEEIIIHKVSLGETVALIAKKYLVRPSEIYAINAGISDGIAQGMMLRIPVSDALRAKMERASKLYADTTAKKPLDAKPQSTTVLEKAEPIPFKQVKPLSEEVVKETVVETEIVEVEEVAPEVAIEETIIEPSEVITTKPTELPKNGVFEVKHTVTSGQTLTGLSRRYNTTIKAITDANASKLRNGLQIGQELTIPAGPTPETMEGTIVHDVQSGETLMGLARKYNTTVAAIEEYNKRKLKHGLQTGQKLTIMPGAAE
ncbi:LysM peptidoglycan-binding domain-containing protein [Flavobacterium litorale]|uniref:LysM peptidoglycan-binding domain-containing protein n=1 Tax=Flavobacterium litorale TaxID=2856519 RepID=A0ABX8V5N0_9FLAO|nr:LysM peptidoglycan-binding domain-containing protein [Flavobacterium litorale]QYJ68145.1 LysM peptidoglycan-binding domain-containing protein [Flavobacterium litorale]